MLKPWPVRKIGKTGMVKMANVNVAGRPYAVSLLRGMHFVEGVDADSLIDTVDGTVQITDRMGSREDLAQASFAAGVRVCFAELKRGGLIEGPVSVRLGCHP